MPALFRSHSDVKCFFCQTPTPPLKNPRNFRCPTCGCWNRYDENGEILSDEPAMHDESLNSKSFAKRASPSKDRLPTMYGAGPFCHTCHTNQTLLVNLLSNYLPPTNSSEYESRLEMLPEYRESLHLRYPPVCDNCLPAVEEEIRRKDHMARTRALGGWLKESKGKEQQRKVSETHKEMEKIGLEMVAWRIRGCLWAATFVTTLMSNGTAALGYRPWRRFASVQPILPVFVLLSLLWTAWDPTYSSFRRAERQGRDIRVQGKDKYIKTQMAAWSSRLITSGLLALSWYRREVDFLNLHTSNSWRSRLYFAFSLALELAACTISFVVLRLQQPPAIRLVNTNTHRLPLSRSGTPNPTIRSGTPFGPAPLATDPDLLASLSLSSKPVITLANPVFGSSSLLPSTAPQSVHNEDLDTDAMDWTSTDPSSISASEKGKQMPIKQNDDGSWLRPQRFFAPEKPTGLEGLFERTLLVDDAPVPKTGVREQNHAWNWWWVYLSSVVPLVGVAVAYSAWDVTFSHISHAVVG